MGTEAYLRAALAPSTQKAYASAVSLYTAFCTKRGYPVYPLRADHAAEWLTAMAGAGGRTAATISQYKSALHTLFASTQFFTDLGSNPLGHPKLKRLLTGISNAKAAPERAAYTTSSQCSPLTFDLVRQLRAVHSDGDPREVMLYAAIAWATAACMQPSEPTPANIAAAGGWATGSVVWQTHFANASEVRRARAVQVNAQMQNALALSSGTATSSSTAVLCGI